jgi:hypothetical protein
MIHFANRSLGVIRDYASIFSYRSCLLEKATSLNKMHAKTFLNRIQELGLEQVETACEIREDEFTEFE